MLVLEQDFAKDSCTAEPEAYTLEGKTERKMRKGGWGRGRGKGIGGGVIGIEWGRVRYVVHVL